MQMYAIPLMTFFFVISSYVKTRRVFNPVGILCFWWGFWLYVSNFSLAGLYVPSFYTQFLYMLMLTAMVFGCLCVPSVRRVVWDETRGQRILGRWNLMRILLLAVSPIVVFYFKKALGLLSMDTVGSAYRNEAFGAGDSILFGAGYAQPLYHAFVIPIVFMSFIAGVVFYNVYRQRLLLWWTVLLLCMDAVMMLGRVSFYIMFSMMLFGALFHKQGLRLNRNHSRQKFDKSKRWGVSLGLAVGLIVLTVLVSNLRGIKSEDADLRTTIMEIVVNYHTGGFVMFDSERRDPRSLLNSKMTYGRGLLGALDTLTVWGIRRFDKSIRDVSGEIGEYLHDYRVLGQNQGIPVLMNAFATILYPLYFDGREIMVFIVPWFYGYWLTLLYRRWIQNEDIHSFMLVLLLLYVGIFSIFHSFAADFRFWPVLLGFITLHKVVWRYNHQGILLPKN